MSHTQFQEGFSLTFFIYSKHGAIYETVNVNSISFRENTQYNNFYLNYTLNDNNFLH